MFHPLMPDLSNKTTEELVKEMNDLYVKLRMFGRQSEMLNQVMIILNAYKEEYQKRLAADYQKSKTKEQKNNRKSND